MNPTSDNIKLFLDSTSFKKTLSADHRNFLEVPITKPELNSAIKAKE